MDNGFLSAVISPGWRLLSSVGGDTKRISCIMILPEMEVTAGIYNLCFYSVKDTLGNELWYGVTRFRMKKEGDKLICEELDTRQNELGIGEWQSVDQNELRIKIWDNGNPEEAGTVRIYRRLNEEG